jgi:hypothetical protein
VGGVNRSLDGVLRRVVARAYPELQRHRIAIEFGGLSPDACFFYYQQGGRYGITVSDLLRKAPRRVLEGGVAHELSHIVHDSRPGPSQRERGLRRYARSAAYRMRDERETDLRLIERGYGRQLLAFLSYAGRLGFRFTRQHGLIRAEIVSRLRTQT